MANAPYPNYGKALAPTVWQEIFADWFVLRELIFAIRTDWFFLLAVGNEVLRFSESTQYAALIIFSFLLSKCNRNTYFQTINQYFVVYRFVF